MRLAFMGSPAFSVPALTALHEAGHAIGAVYSQPPRPVGRGHAVRPCPVHAAAERLGLAVRTPARLRGDDAAQAAFAALELDAAVVVAYGLILPPAMLAAPRFGCLNIHASLLPRWRGAAPIQAAVRAGDDETGVTIMRMDAGLDTGPMLLTERVPITTTTTAATLHHTLAAIGARLILQALAADPPETPQPETGASYAPKLTRADARIDWTDDAVAIERQVRAFDPWPGTFTLLDGAMLKVLACVPAEDSGAPGFVLDDRLTVACGRGAVRLARVQLAGRAPTQAEAFLRGHKVPAGTRLG
ncbi:MAG TPA: methionyl-tRNA formyltransferase [Acetobacteraceae bacterium]|nr:methionyl-tRNA formyltransferase [Acetobacteraceae bacterium]